MTDQKRGKQETHDVYIIMVIHACMMCMKVDTFECTRVAMPFVFMSSSA